MKCPYCGIENNSNNIKCLSCNAPLHEENKIEETNNLEIIDKEKLNSEDKNTLKIYYIYVGTIIFMAIIFLAVFVIKLSNYKELSIIHYILFSIPILSLICFMFFVYPKAIKKRFKKKGMEE